jgi:hypothetical protein
MAQAVKYLSSEHEDLSSKPQDCPPTKKKKKERRLSSIPVENKMFWNKKFQSLGNYPFLPSKQILTDLAYTSEIRWIGRVRCFSCTWKLLSSKETL